jgi:hypothetical protein
MIDETAANYRHTQRPPWHLLLDAFGAALLVASEAQDRLGVSDDVLGENQDDGS